MCGATPQGLPVAAAQHFLNFFDSCSRLAAAAPPQPTRRLVVSSICLSASAAVAGPSPASSRHKRSLASPPDLCNAGGKSCHPAPNQRAFSMFSQVKIGYCGPSPPPVPLALRPSTAALSQRVRSLGDCSDRMALESRRRWRPLWKSSTRCSPRQPSCAAK